LQPLIVVIPNGVDLPPLGGHQTERKGDRRAVFLSRIHPIKGLPLLLHAWAKVQPARWRLIIVGPDPVGHKAELLQLTSQLMLGSRVEFLDPVYGQEKWALLETADLFVLPTLSENFGIAVAEALANSVPVLTTTRTPWRVLEQNRCGWWVDPSVEGISRGLMAATGLSDEERLEMGVRGRNLMKDRFGWRSIAEQMRAVYDLAASK
jgi:glycosyltransferase involved in cell wall biosynthesis